MNASRRMPALLTRTSSWPNVVAPLGDERAGALPRRRRRRGLRPPRRPLRRSPPTTRSAGLASAPVPSGLPPRSLTTTLAPSAANSSACSRPMPLPAPVITATRPSSAPIVMPTSARPSLMATLPLSDVVSNTTRPLPAFPQRVSDRLARLDDLRESHREALEPGGILGAVRLAPPPASRTPSCTARGR